MTMNCLGTPLGDEIGLSRCSPVRPNEEKSGTFADSIPFSDNERSAEATNEAKLEIFIKQPPYLLLHTHLLYVIL